MKIAILLIAFAMAGLVEAEGHPKSANVIIIVALAEFMHTMWKERKAS